MATPAPVGDIPEKAFQPPDPNFPKCKLVRQLKFADHFKVPGLADGNGCTMMPLMISTLPFEYHGY